MPDTETIEIELPTEETATEEVVETPETEETFPRAYVEQLRQESAGYRTRAQRSDALAAALWEARVAATGRLVNPAELPLPDDADPMDAEAVNAAVEALLTAKPYLANRIPRGDIGQGAVGGGEDFSLADVLRAGAS